VLRGKHQHQGGAIAKDQQVSGCKEHAQVRTPAIHVGEHRAQAGREADPAAPAEHPGIGAQCVAKETGGASSIQALAVGGLRLALSLGQVLLLAAAAVGCGQQGPAVSGDLQRGLQCGKGGMGMPGAWCRRSHDDTA
jgi:hypothetical protein